MSAEDIVNSHATDIYVAGRVAVKLHELGLIDDQAFLDIIRPVTGYGDISIRNEHDQ